jgi:indolepyruvate ferredoxin oxidoreductase
MTWGWTTPPVRVGHALHKVGVVWPLEAQLTREFASGLQEILVVEEKRQVIEYQLKEELYNWRADVRPNVLGKFSEGEGDFSGGEWSFAQPQCQHLAACQCGFVAGHHRARHCPAPAQAGAGRRYARRVSTRNWRILAAKERSMQVIAGTDPAKARGLSASPGFVPGARTTLLPCARGLACHGRHWLPLHDHLDGPRHGGLHADGRRGCALGGAAAL